MVTAPRMTLPIQRRLTLTSLLGLGWWFFGNLYEAFVFSPNWIHDSPAQMARLHQFFVATTPTLYFVPVTPLAVAAVWLLLALNRQPTVAAAYRRASVWGAISMAVNIFIVATVITRLFGSDALSHPEDLNALCWRWNALNVVRMGTVAATSAALFRAYLLLDRLSDQARAGT